MLFGLSTMMLLDSNHARFLSYYVVLRMSSTVGEPRKGERSCLKIHRGRPVGDHLSQNAPRGRRMLKPMSTEAADYIKARNGVDRAYYRHRVGSHFIEPRPRMRDRSLT